MAAMLYIYTLTRLMVRRSCRHVIGSHVGNLIPYILFWDPDNRIEVVRLFASTGKSTWSYASNPQTPKQMKAVNLELRSRALQ